MSSTAGEQATIRVWEPMRLRHVGDVGEVMRRKSGRKRDPSVHSWRRKKRGHGHGR